MNGFAPTIPSQTGTPDDWEAWSEMQAAKVNSEAEQQDRSRDEQDPHHN